MSWFLQWDEDITVANKRDLGNFMKVVIRKIELDVVS
jgi:hypothetical protein